MGLQLPASEIDGTAPNSGPCISDALVSVGPAGRGGTGSFISSSGLIITNHHVALDAVRQASTASKDLLNDGFVARSREEEVKGPDYECWITRGVEDVSAAVLAGAAGAAGALARANALRDAAERIGARRERVQRHFNISETTVSGSAKLSETPVLQNMDL